jgi:hypothetical protein
LQTLNGGTDVLFLIACMLVAGIENDTLNQVK